MKKLFLLIFLLPLLAFAQEKGIHFQHGLTWQQVKEKAKAENKYIFIDCFTTWCGPCRYMSANIFPLEEVGNVFNDKFISIKIQLDSTANDNEEVKSWFKDAFAIAKEYNVRAYPTYLFFDPNANIVHRAVGSSDAKEFITKAENAMNPDKQYYALINQYKKGNKEPAFLKKAALAAMDAYDMDNGEMISNEYLATQKDLYTKENLDFISIFTLNSKDAGFKAMLKNPAKADAVLGNGVAEGLIQRIIIKEEILNKLHGQQSQADWKNISAGLNKKYPLQAAEALSKGKVMFYQSKGDWNNFQTAVVSYMNKYGAKASVGELNNYAWTVFENCKDMTCVAEALEWSKRSFKDNNEPGLIDTYANILYKMGKKDEAIAWEEKAMNLAGENDKQGFKETLEKMQKGEKTWKD